MHIRAITEDFSFTGESFNKIHKFSSSDKNYFRRTTTELDQRRAYKKSNNAEKFAFKQS